ncbi:MAG: tetratricopeptide repeat protein [Elainellaceae cyanobacterium]
MAKRKKKSALRPTRGFGVKKLERELNRVLAYAAKADWDTVCKILLPLCEEHPQELRVWQYLADASFELDNLRLYQKACEGLFTLDPTNAEYAYALGSACLNNVHPLMALHILRQALELDPDHEHAGNARKSIKTLEKFQEEALAQIDLPDTAESLAIAILHERGQAYMEQGDYAAARMAEEEALKRYPDFLSVRNNLSLISWLEGDVEGAIAAAQEVLERQPDNIHALSNLIHFWVVSGDEEKAKPYGDRLKASQADAWEGWTKKVEGLSYLADDAGVVAVWEEAQKDGIVETPGAAMFHHLSAVALARTGDTKRAISQWKKVSSRQEIAVIAQENLTDIRRAVSKRHGAWPFDWNQWLTTAATVELKQSLEAGLNAKGNRLVATFKEFLSRHPEVVAALPRLLERSGPQGQAFVLEMAEQAKTPELLSAVKDFALGQSGTDQMRNRAAVMAAQAKLISKENVRLWINGEWQEVTLMAYEFHGEPLANHPKPVERLMKQALPLLKSGDEADAVEAEALMNQALEIVPDAPDLLNNLAMAYQAQGREDETEDLIRDIAERYPDYTFARVSLAKMHLMDGDVDEAEALLLPMLKRDRFHFLEFSAFSDAYIEMLVAKKQKDAARSWLGMWEQVDGDDLRLARWQRKLSGKLGLLGF